MGDAGWREAKFGDVVRLNKETSRDPVADGLERFVGLEHLAPGDFRVRSWGDIAEGTTFTNRFRPGHVLFGKRRAYQRKLAVADFDGVCSGDIYVLEPKDPNELLPAYLPYLCLTNAFFDHAIGTSAGSLSPRTNWNSLAEYRVSLPPVAVQEKHCRMLTSANRVAEETSNALEAARMVYSAVLFDTFAPGRETASGVPPDAWRPRDWGLSLLGELTDPENPICYGIVQPGHSVEGGVPTVNSNNLNIGFREGIHLTSPDIESKYSRSRVRGGDVLLTVKGFGTGNIAIIPEFFEGNITRDVARARFATDADARFFRHLWRSAPFERYWRMVSVGTTRPELSIGKLRAMKVPWPPPRTRERVADALSGVERMAELLDERRDHALRVRQAVVERVVRPEMS